jgi:hypothetical protein
VSDEAVHPVTPLFAGGELNLERAIFLVIPALAGDISLGRRGVGVDGSTRREFVVRGGHHNGEPARVHTKRSREGRSTGGFGLSPTVP